LLDDIRIRIRTVSFTNTSGSGRLKNIWILQILIRNTANLFQNFLSLVQIEFFRGGEEPCSVLDEEHGVLFVKKPDGRATGDAFVLFRSAFLRHKT
jgi:hypothetical protein